MYTHFLMRTSSEDITKIHNNIYSNMLEIVFLYLLDIEIYIFLSINGILTYSNKNFLIIELIYI